MPSTKVAVTTVPRGNGANGVGVVRVRPGAGMIVPAIAKANGRPARLTPAVRVRQAEAGQTVAVAIAAAAKVHAVILAEVIAHPEMRGLQLHCRKCR